MVVELLPCPFRVVVDSMEKAPWSFVDIPVRAADDPRPPSERNNQWHWAVERHIAALGPGMGDYSIIGLQKEVSIERKSQDDAYGTLLGWRDRRDRFKRELSNLSMLDCAAVVIECSFGQLLDEVPSHGTRSTEGNRKLLHSTILAWTQKYRIPWYWCDSRRLAELTAFRLLESHWRYADGRAKRK